MDSSCWDSLVHHEQDEPGRYQLKSLWPHKVTWARLHQASLTAEWGGAGLHHCILSRLLATPPLSYVGRGLMFQTFVKCLVISWVSHFYLTGSFVLMDDACRPSSPWFKEIPWGHFIVKTANVGICNPFSWAGRFSEEEGFHPNLCGGGRVELVSSSAANPPGTRYGSQHSVFI